MSGAMGHASASFSKFGSEQAGWTSYLMLGDSRKMPKGGLVLKAAIQLPSGHWWTTPDAPATLTLKFIPVFYTLVLRFWVKVMDDKPFDADASGSTEMVDEKLQAVEHQKMGRPQTDHKPKRHPPADCSRIP